MDYTKEFEQVKAFTLKRGTLNKKNLTWSTKIEDDLDITGDDAYDFMVEFSEEFNIDVSEFNFIKYFTEEGFLINFQAIKRWFKGEKNYWKLKPLTLGDLAVAISTGKIT